MIDMSHILLLRRACQVETVFCCQLQSGYSDSSVVHLLFLVLNYANVFLNAAVWNWHDANGLQSICVCEKTFVQ
jgi:hypothetical protein